MNREILAYRVEQVWKPQHIADLNELLAEGWQPWGSPYADDDGFGFQALVMYEEEASR